ncbi:uncharacterized protein KIAA0825 homolog isoform X2 [Genypterus blacodes]|uniref:uncharacterized protein KIAA0825 homolog isoform X2 n=1 Tax=Genypterus blacodes TaxID=154954 RepID=UPI003F75F4BD
MADKDSCIEQQLKELQAKLGESSTDERPPSPADCMQMFNLRLQSNFRPVTTGHQELMDFFRALQQYLRSEVAGKEEVMLQLLMNLSAKCGVCFPCTHPSSSLSSSSLPLQHTTSSIHLIHSIRDDASLELQEAWDDVRISLRRHLLDRLSSRNNSSLSIPERVHCLQKLCFLYPDSEVLTLYQGLRSHSVLVLLHSALSSGPGSEISFNRLAASFRSVVPALIQALREDLHVLSGLAEPHSILGFINVVYLGAVVRELASTIEKECEMAQRDNSTVSSKIKKYSARSRATVVPMEIPQKSKGFNLTSHQLGALTQLVCTLLGFESDVKELVTNMTFINCTGETPSIKGILKKTRQEADKVAEAADGKKATTDTLLHTPESLVLDFDWRSAFKGLVPQMAHCVKVVLDNVCTKTLQQEVALHSSGHVAITMTNTATGNTSAATASNGGVREECAPHPCSERETPKMIAKFCGSIVAELDALLPLAVACRDAGLLEVRSSFVEACGTVAFAVLGHLQERALEVPSSAPLKNLPALLATCIYMYQRLECYHARLKESTTVAAKTPLTLLPIQKYKDTATALRDQLTGHCIQVCYTSILQDAESHHWADPKPFYEGERCSFAVQMWFYFLCGLRSDLWAVLPADLAKEVLGEVLAETLRQLVQRYARARPSYRRHLQIRCDITAVLLYVEQLMWSVCDSPEALVHAGPSAAIDIISVKPNWPYQIHSLCEQLLTVMVVNTAPLALLKRTFMRNPVDGSTPLRPDKSVTHWLNAMDPDLFTERSVRDGLTGQAASVCQLRLLTSDPGNSPRLLLRMLLHRDCHLPRILLENSHFFEQGEISAESVKAGDDFIVALFDLLSILNAAPKALTQALQPYLEGTQVWERLYTLADTTQTGPVVLSLVRAVVNKSTNGLLVHLIAMVVGLQSTEDSSGALFKGDVPECVLTKIPKEWNFTALEAQGVETATKTVTSLAIQALSFVFTNLPMVVASLPLPIRFLFHEAEKHLSQHSRQLRSTGLLLWVLLDCLVQGLEDPDTLEQVNGLALDRGAKDCLALLAECLQAAMGITQKGVPKPTVHKVLQALEEKRPKWTTVQLQKARKLCSESMFEQGRENGVAAAELTEQKIGLMLLEVCHKAGGSDYLRQIYHIIQGNEDLLMSKLTESRDSPCDPSHLVNFVSKTHMDATCFNPLKQFDHVGKKKLDQSAVVDWAWDWPRLLPAYQDTSQVTFKTLLANRWEMQEGAELEDEEKALTEELQRAFSLCSCSRGGTHDPAEAARHTEEQAQQPST